MSGHHACAVTLPMLTSPSSTGFLAFSRIFSHFIGQEESRVNNFATKACTGRLFVRHMHEYTSVQARVYDIDHINIKYQPPFYDIDHININPSFNLTVIIMS